jgi:hypothetical protein
MRESVAYLAFEDETLLKEFVIIEELLCNSQESDVQVQLSLLCVDRKLQWGRRYLLLCPW